MRLLLFGVYDLGFQVLGSMLSAGYRPLAVVTRADSSETTSSIAQLAKEEQIELWQPHSIKDSSFLFNVQQLNLDLTVVAGFDKKLPTEVITSPRKGTINVHGSLLPKYRGPSTWKQAIMNGEIETGVSIHKMTFELDRGDILAQSRITIAHDDTGGSLFQKICQAGAELLPVTLKHMEEGSVQTTIQEENQATYYSYVTDADAFVNFNQNADRVRNHIRALNPRPGAWCSFKSARMIVSYAELTDTNSFAAPGTIIEITSNRFCVATATTNVWLTMEHCHIIMQTGDQFDLYS